MKNESLTKYLKFFGMILTSMIAMYVLMYLNTAELYHIRWSETRVYMTFIMGAAMAIIMLTFMRNMYTHRAVNFIIYAGSVAVFLISLFLVRTQANVQDSSWMSAMIPHHSIAILTSENAEIRDVRVQELANDIIDTQKREIQEMDWLLQDISANGIVTSIDEAELRPVPDFEVED